MGKVQNIAVLGSGILGLMNAYTLARSGHTVTLYDPKGFPAKNASWIAGGMLAPYSEIEHMDVKWVFMGLGSIELWREMPIDCGFEQKGSLLLAHKEDSYILERFRAHLPTEKQELHSIETLEPDLQHRFSTTLYLEEEAHIHPHTAMQSLINALKNNVKMIERAAIPNKCDTDFVIDCRGLESADRDLRGVKGEIVLVQNEEFSLSRPVRLMHPRYPLYIVPRPDHVFMIGATVIESEDATHVTLRSAMELMSALYSLHPSFGEAKVLDILSGIRPSYPDNLPRITVKENVISCNGSFRHGYLLAPIMASAVKQHINGQTHEYWPLLNKDQKDENHDQRAA